MPYAKGVKLVASGAYLPPPVSSEVIEQRLGLPLGWTLRHSGVRTRHHVVGESNGYMGARAIEHALAQAGMQLRDIDLIISAGATFDYPLPNKASVIKRELVDGAAVHVPALDVDATCLSFVAALDVAARFLDGRQYRNVVIVSSEIASKGLHPTKAEIATLFGDAAVAFVLTYDEIGRHEYLHGVFKTFSEGLEHTMIRGGGNKYFFRDHPYDVDLHSFSMDGLKLLKLAKREAQPFLYDFLAAAGITLADIDVIIPHQTSRAGLELLHQAFPFRGGQVKSNLLTRGNCIAASIPLLLHETIAAGEIQRGDLCLLTGTAAGMTMGAALFRY